MITEKRHRSNTIPLLRDKPANITDFLPRRLSREFLAEAQWRGERRGIMRFSKKNRTDLFTR
jgi:hypothetical protein